MERPVVEVGIPDRVVDRAVGVLIDVVGLILIVMPDLIPRLRTRLMRDLMFNDGLFSEQ